MNSVNYILPPKLYLVFTSQAALFVTDFQRYTSHFTVGFLFIYARGCILYITNCRIKLCRICGHFAFEFFRLI